MNQKTRSERNAIQEMSAVAAWSVYNLSPWSNLNDMLSTKDKFM